MIYIKNIRNIGDYNKYDGVWAIVRSMKSTSPHIKQITALSPSKELFFKYWHLKTNGQWNQKSFRSEYVPQFLQELKHGDEKGYTLLNTLYRADKEDKKICLVCFCADETLCHRSIIAGLLQAVGCYVETETGNDYSGYYQMYRSLS